MNKDITELLHKIDNSLDEIFDIFSKIHDDHVMERYKISSIFDNLFSHPLIAEHVDYKISRVLKSTFSLNIRDIDETNSYLHLKLNLKTDFIINLNEIYDNRINDLLDFFKGIFQVLNNINIYSQQHIINQWKSFIEELKNDILVFLNKSERQENKLNELKNTSQNFNEYTLKNDWLKFKKILKEYAITCLYHFTDKSNIASIIKSGGLFSYNYCIQNNIEISIFASDSFSRDQDKKKGLSNHIRLSFIEKHPMMYISRDRGDILDPIILEIDPIVIGWGDTQFSDKNATCNDAKIFDDFEQFSNLNFKLFKLNYFSIKSTKDKMDYKSEVLVKRHIPLQYILNINKYKNMI